MKLSKECLEEIERYLEEEVDHFKRGNISWFSGNVIRTIISKYHKEIVGIELLQSSFQLPIKKLMNKVLKKHNLKFKKMWGRWSTYLTEKNPKYKTNYL